MKSTILHPDRLFPSDPPQRSIAQALYANVRDLPIVSPHGHTNPQWFAQNKPFANPAALFVTPDHYIYRMLYSQGVKLEDLGVRRLDGGSVESDPRKVWRLFAKHYYLFRGTPTRLWIDHALETLFGLTSRLDANNADHHYDVINEALQTPAFAPRALFERFNIEVIATTEGPLDELKWHQMIRDSGWKGRVITAYRPDSVVDPDFVGFHGNVKRLGELTGEDSESWSGYLAAHRKRRAYFKTFGATSTDHGHPTALTADLNKAEAEALFARILAPHPSAQDKELFRAQMLTEMAAMSCDDGLVLQIHPGSMRNHNPALFANFGRDTGHDIPTRTDYVNALKPLLDRFGNRGDLTIILFTLDETSYSRELAPLAGHYPALRLGPAWWFFDLPEGMMRFRELTTKPPVFITLSASMTTRGLSRLFRLAMMWPDAWIVLISQSWLRLHQLDQSEAHELAHDLAYRLAKTAYKL